MKTINLVVLLNDSPMGRAYLRGIKDAGYKPKLILNIINKKAFSQDRNIISIIPSGKIKSYLMEKIQHNSNFYWPNKLLKEKPNQVKSIFNYLRKQIKLSEEAFYDVCGKRSLRYYSDNIINVEINGFADKNFSILLETYSSSTILFTGGGLLPKKLFDIKKLRLLHVHPGILPYIRGADGFFWSILIRKRLGLSCFIMNAGLDTGDLIKTIELPMPKLEINTKNEKNIKNTYRLIYSFLDPLLRGHLLQNIIVNTNNNIDTIRGKKQDIKKGKTYTFMSKKLLKIALNIISK